MSERETFLARWSRRKQTAAAEPTDADCPAEPAPAACEEPVEGRARVEGLAGAERAPASDAIAPQFDPASLPPIESIAADSDIRAFLAPGVPPELARAALRRAWAADPKIRDFVGLADYDWDFNAPGSMAGFGPLEMTEELREIAARIIGPPPATAQEAGAATSPDVSGQVDSSANGSPAELVGDRTELETDAGDPSSERDSAFAAAQNRPAAAEKSQIVVQPRHGRALPK